MKILFDHPSPFILAHGGFQTQIEQTKCALESLGVETEYLRWWDSQQSGDLIHHFSPASTGYLKLARARHLPVVMTTLFTETCNRSDLHLARQKWLIRFLLSLPGGQSVKDQLVWRSFRLCSQNVVGLEAERRVLEVVYGVPSEKVSVIPLGLSEAYLDLHRVDSSQSYLICTGTITRRKRCVELAQMAHQTQTPILFVGKPYHPSDPYWLQFESLIDGRFVNYHPHVEEESEMIGLLQSARGFVLMSDYENWSLAAHEAAACGLPLLVPDQPWSRERFGTQARYFAKNDVTANREILRNFYQEAPTIPAPEIKQYTWRDTARELTKLYENLMIAS